MFFCVNFFMENIYLPISFSLFVENVSKKIWKLVVKLVVCLRYNVSYSMIYIMFYDLVCYFFVN